MPSLAPTAKYNVAYGGTKPGETWWCEMLVDVPVHVDSRIERISAILKADALAFKIGGKVIGCKLEKPYVKPETA